MGVRKGGRCQGKKRRVGKGRRKKRKEKKEGRERGGKREEDKGGEREPLMKKAKCQNRNKGEWGGQGQDRGNLSGSCGCC